MTNRRLAVEFLDRIDPTLREGLALYEMLGLGDHQRLDGQVIPALRAQGDEAAAALLATLPRDDRVSREDHLIRTPAGDLLVRMYRPRSSTSLLPAVIWLHGGGMMFGSIEFDGPTCEGYAIAVDCAVLSVQYRLAPEFPYPAAVDDCFAALTWSADHASQLKIDPERIAVGGESAGAGLAAATALLTRDRGGPRIAFQALAYPMLDDRNNTPSACEFAEIPSWSHQHNRSAWLAVLGERAGGANVEPYAAPARAADLSGLPPSLLQVGELDVLRDENIAYATRLMQAGVSTELHVYPGAYHGWDAAAPEAPKSIRARDERTGSLIRALRR
jgi:acetyl esterase/lipase